MDYVRFVMIAIGKKYDSLNVSGEDARASVVLTAWAVQTSVAWKSGSFDQ